jgi:hypothetical protein
MSEPQRKAPAQNSRPDQFRIPPLAAPKLSRLLDQTPAEADSVRTFGMNTYTKMVGGWRERLSNPGLRLSGDKSACAPGRGGNRLGCGVFRSGAIGAEFFRHLL